MTRRASDVLLDILRDEGITHIFGNPGSTEMPLMDALVNAPDITYVLGLQEATAVGMADGWALTSGKTGFVPSDAITGLGGDEMCFSKDASGWKIAGYFGGAGE
jgi:benzoylformate decarboxylase